MSENIDELEPKKVIIEYKTPSPIKMIQDYLGPLNTLYLIPGSIAVALDLLSPLGPLLFSAAIATGVLVIINFLLRNRVDKNGKKFHKTKFFLFALISFLVFSGSATANFSHKTDGGALANWVPQIKKWQDAYLVSIKKDTAEINKKVDKTNIMLAQVLDSLRPQLEKPLIEEIPNYVKLPEHQKQALMLFTQKVGTNGVKKYKGLIKATNLYADNQTPENARLVAEHFKYVVRVNGKDIEDTKSKMLIMSLFLDPETYNYLTGNGEAPSNTNLLKEFNIDISKPLDVQLEDPLGDFIKNYELQNGTPPEQKVVIPKIENLGDTTIKKSTKPVVKMHPKYM